MAAPTAGRAAPAQARARAERPPRPVDRERRPRAPDPPRAGGGGTRKAGRRRVSEVVDLFLGASRVTTIGHENPDGDTLGAALALAVVAERLGKTAEVVCADPPPPFLDFLPGIGRVKQAPTLEPDLAVVVDAA